MTKYRGFDIQRVQGKRDIWFSVIKDGVVLHNAATEHHAMQWIDHHLAQII